jgi:hypothetical protein
MAENDNDMTTPQESIPAQVSEPIAPATPLPAAVTSTEKGKSVRNYALGAVAGVVGVLLFLGAGVVGYAIGHNDSERYRGGELAVSADRGGPHGEGYEEGHEEGYGDRPMKGHDDEYGMNGEMGGNRDDGMMRGPGDMDQRGMNPGDQFGGDFGGNFGDGPMMQGNGIQDFLNQLQGGEGLTPDQQQFLDQLRGFVGGMRNQMG